MFSALVRTQLFATARIARPASRNLSALAASRVLPTATRIIASRTFTQSAVAAGNPPSNIVYLANLPWSTTEEELRELLGEFGEIEEVRMPSHTDGRPRGFAHISFSTQGQAEAAVGSAQEEPLHLNGRDLFADFGMGRRNLEAPQPVNKLYFQNFEGDEEALRQILAEFNDQIVSVFFLRDSVTGQTINKGFVEFETTPQATTVLDEFADSDVFRLSYARPRRENGDRPGGRPRRFDNNNSSRRYDNDSPRRYDNNDGSRRPDNNNDRSRGHYAKRDWQPRD